MENEYKTTDENDFFEDKSHDVYVKEKLEFYKESDLAVHLNLIKGRWMNGTIKTIREDSFVLDEERFGVTLIFFKEVINLNPRKKKEDDNGMQ